MLIHNPFVAAVGDEKAMRSAAEGLGVAKTNLVKIYTKASGKSAEEIASMMDAETNFTAEQAKAAGLIDEITDPFLPNEIIEPLVVHASARMRPVANVGRQSSSEWGSAMQNKIETLIMSFSELFDKMKGPSPREEFFAKVFTDATIDPDELYKQKDSTVLATMLNKLVESRTIAALAEHKAQLDRILGAFKAADLDLTIEKIDTLKDAIASRVEIEASRKMQGMSAARGIKPVTTNGQTVASAIKTYTQQCIEANGIRPN